MGDVRTYENVVALRAVESINGIIVTGMIFEKSFFQMFQI